jgi:hypothetical protein
MEVIIWSSGDKCQKSHKSQKPLFDSNNKIIDNIPQRAETYTRKKDKINEEKYQEIRDRPMLVQTCLNPFLSRDFNDVIGDQEKYLKSKNSLDVEKD